MSSLVKSLLLAFVFITIFLSCDNSKKNPNFQEEAANPEFLHRSLLSLTSTIKHDLFAPMVAARIYGYANIAAYEALIAGSPNYKSMAGQLKDLNELPKPEADKEYCYPIASVQAYLKVGKKWIFSEDSIDVVTAKILQDFRNIGIPKDVFERSLAFGNAIGDAIIAWSAKDNYPQTRSMPKYTVKIKDESRWQPTAPDYADAVEPHWNKIRTLVMDSAAQFKPVPPTPYNTNKSSQFYKEAYEVFKSVQDSTPERIAIARYWDDSPSSTQNAGHVNFTIKKVTPPGHWLHIAMYVARQQKIDIYRTAEINLLLSIALFDGVISCWDEKYRSEVVRPETYINKYINPNWLPIIVTPPFPEYTSGHSVFSGSASQVLERAYSNKVAFIDSTEVQFGMAARSFSSFSEAADQAAISRLYGGIHYRPAIEIGVKQGREVGNFIFDKIKTRK